MVPYRGAVFKLRASLHIVATIVGEGFVLSPRFVVQYFCVHHLAWEERESLLLYFSDVAGWARRGGVV